MSTRKVKDETLKQTKSTASKAKNTKERAKIQPKFRTNLTKKTENNEEKTAKKDKVKKCVTSSVRVEEEKKVQEKAKVSSRKTIDNREKSQKIANKLGRTPLATKKMIAKPDQKSSNRPVTPPSSRVTKSQYFPSKTMYSNALKVDDNTKSKQNSNFNKTPVAEKKENSETSSILERPKTATLEKGSIVNKNIAGPEVAQSISQDMEYEEDFDSYESDFEHYSSSDSASQITTGTTSSDTQSPTPIKRVSSAGTDDEKKLDSGNYELPEPRHRQILDNIKESIEKENALLAVEQNRANLRSLPDEGFEEGKSLQFINFLGAQQKYKRKKSFEARQKRGEEILSMIHLDHYNFTLFELPSVPYETFIQNFGRRNTIQVSSQTRDDDVDEEIQTDEITYTNKWTQFPPILTIPESKSEHFWEIYRCSCLGVGEDKTETIREDKLQNVKNNKLEEFLTNAGNLILELQTEALVQETIETTTNNLPFSKGHIVFDTQKQKLLENRRLTNVCFCGKNKILSVHGTNSTEEIKNNVICLWRLSKKEKPEMCFGIYGEVCCISYSEDCPRVFFCGLNDGTVVLWDMRENQKLHKIVNSSVEDLIRSPTYRSEVNSGHLIQVVAIYPLQKTFIKPDFFSNQKTFEICSLDVYGEIIIWGVIFKQTENSIAVEQQGLAHWGSVILTINLKISLKTICRKTDDFCCTDLGVSHLDPNKLFISTDCGVIIHCLANGGKTTVKHFLSGSKTQANCLELCPFSPEYIISGFNNGNINFYCRSFEKALITLSNSRSSELDSKIELIQWSRNRPLIFYTTNGANTIYIWDLSISDMFPTISVPFEDNIVSMKLSPITANNNDDVQNTYMIISTDKNIFYVHVLNKEHGQLQQKQYEEEKRKFINYIDRFI